MAKPLGYIAGDAQEAEEIIRRVARRKEKRSPPGDLSGGFVGRIARGETALPFSAAGLTEERRQWQAKQAERGQDFIQFLIRHGFLPKGDSVRRQVAVDAGEAALRDFRAWLGK
jgi:hypothetical protein